MKKVFVLAAAASILAASSANAQVMITSIMDGGMTGGTPKVLELKNYTGAPANLTDINIWQNSNGTGTTHKDLGAILFAATASSTLPAGQFIVLTSETANFNAAFPSLGANVTVIQDSVANNNGDDPIIIYADANDNLTYDAGDTIIDIFGVIGLDGSGLAWDHLDSYATRISGPATSTWTAGQWNVRPINTLDPETTAANYSTLLPLGTNTSLPVELDSFQID